MCGITGYITNQPNTAIEQGNLTSLLLASCVRGEDATGIGYIKHDRLHIIKNGTPARTFINSHTYKRAIKKTGHIAIGHTRAGTTGEATDNRNNHPIYSQSGIAIIHNGIISNHNALFEKYHLKRDGLVDSEIILRLLEYFTVTKHYKMKTAIQKACKLIRGSMAVAVLDIREPDTLYLFVRTSPLVMAYHKKRKTIYFASTQDILTSALINYKSYVNFFYATTNKKQYVTQEVQDNTGLIVKHDKITTFTIDEPDYYEPTTGYTYDGYGKTYSQPTLPAITKKSKALTKLQAYKKDKQQEAELDAENKATEAQLETWKHTQIAKPSRCTTQRLEERSAELEDRDISYRSNATGQPLDIKEIQELQRIHNALDDRWKKDAQEEAEQVQAQAEADEKNSLKLYNRWGGYNYYKE